jgi:hypothetical protein
MDLNLGLQHKGKGDFWILSDSAIETGVSDFFFSQLWAILI